jgi:hypothetical protein
MRTPFYITLAQIDRERTIATCRHGLVHLSWGRTTLRFTRDEFRRLAALLKHAASAPPPFSFRDGGLRATTRPGEECELQIGALVLLLPHDEFQRLSGMVQEAVQRMEAFLASGGWKDEPPELQESFLEQLRKTYFSQN